MQKEKKVTEREREEKYNVVNSRPSIRIIIILIKVHFIYSFVVYIFHAMLDSKKTSLLYFFMSQYQVSGVYPSTQQMSSIIICNIRFN